MNGKLIGKWKAAVGSRSFVIHLSVTVAALLILLFTIGDFFDHVQSVPGKKLDDPLLDAIPADDMSVVIFTLIYSSLIVGLVYLAMFPRLLLISGETYLFITLMRMATLLLFPLEPDNNMVALNDPFVDRWFYDDQLVTKDLFFSGHVSVLAMLAFVASNFWLKRIFATIALIVGLCLLVQHAHYTIDIVAAPVFAWIGTAVAGRIVSKSVTLP